MIGKIVLTRIEPCFTANKPACGEVARVKKDINQNQNQTNKQISTLNKDTFTSSQKVSNNGHASNVNNVNDKQKNTHKGN